MVSINPYLNFPGTTEEAFNFYRSVFGGEFAMLMRFSDTGETDKLPDHEKNMIMHMALPIGNGTILMGTDTLASMGHTLTTGTNFHLSVNTNSKEEADQFFASISAGGTISMPMADMDWGDYFGMCTDKFGIQWMFSFNEKYKTL